MTAARIWNGERLRLRRGGAPRPIHVTIRPNDDEICTLEALTQALFDGHFVVRCRGRLYPVESWRAAVRWLLQNLELILAGEIRLGLMLPAEPLDKFSNLNFNASPSEGQTIFDLAETLRQERIGVQTPDGFHVAVSAMDAIRWLLHNAARLLAG